MSWPHLFSRRRRTELTIVCSVGWMVEGVIDNIILYMILYIQISHFNFGAQGWHVHVQYSSDVQGVTQYCM